MLKLGKLEGYHFVKKSHILYNPTWDYCFEPVYKWCFASWEVAGDEDSWYTKTGWHYCSCYKIKATAERRAAEYAAKYGTTTKVFYWSDVTFRTDSCF